jgi:hypothetical protein
MYHEPEENVKTFPIPDTHLAGAAVLVCSIIDHEECVSGCRSQLESLQRVVADLWRVTHNLADLFNQMNTSLQLAMAAKEHPVFKAPEWFWQAEGTDVTKMLTRRARYLKAGKQNVDQAWDVLKEFAVDTLRLREPDAPLAEAIKGVFGTQERGS